jgi:hypothetical protein
MQSLSVTPSNGVPEWIDDDSNGKPWGDTLPEQTIVDDGPPAFLDEHAVKVLYVCPQCLVPTSSSCYRGYVCDDCFLEEAATVCRRQS